MYINLESDYAIRIVCFLCSQSDVTSAKAISENSNVSLRFCLKILRKLVNAGILKSYKGNKGGYKSNLGSEKISLKDIIEVIEGPINISKCLDGTYKCVREHSGKCKIQKAFRNVNENIKYELSKISIDELI